MSAAIPATFKRTPEQQKIVMLGYTENNGHPFVSLPFDYFPTPNHERFKQAAAYWLPRIQALLKGGCHD